MKKRRRDLIPAKFAKCNLDNVGEGVAIEQFGDRVSNVEHQHSQATVHFIGAGTASVRCLANAPYRRQRSVNQPNDTTKLPASAFHISGCLKLRKNLLEEFDR